MLEFTFFEKFIASSSVFLAFGYACQFPAVFKALTYDKNAPRYLKAGEYGETEYDNSWSLWKEPLNSWSSLAFSVFGGVALLTGIQDYTNLDSKSNEWQYLPRYEQFPGFSIFFGIALSYLGVASFLFHASHSEPWRKADAGMTSGVLFPLLFFALWDRLRAPAMQIEVYIGLSVLMVVSMTHGFVPYGSSDILAPACPLMFMFIERLPRYGGLVGDSQVQSWYQCFYIGLAAALFRAYDILRKNPTGQKIVIGIFCTLHGIFMFAFLGVTDWVLGSCLVAAIITYVSPAKGHIFWHVVSGFGLYWWWYCVYSRPGNPDTPFGVDSTWATLLFFIAVKNGVRRLFMQIPLTLFCIKTQPISTKPVHNGDAALKVRDRVFFLLEHSVFVAWGWHVIVTENHSKEHLQSWLYNYFLCTDRFPISNVFFAAPSFHLYYLAKMAAYCEDLLYLFVMYYFKNSFNKAAITDPDPLSSEDKESSSHAIETGETTETNQTVAGTRFFRTSADTQTPVEKSSDDNGYRNVADGNSWAISLHHVVTAVLCITSYITHYTKIGSLVMFLHDISDVALDLMLIVFRIRSWRSLQIVTFIVALLTHIYWKIWFLGTVVLWLVFWDMHTDALSDALYGAMEPWAIEFERTIWLVLLGTLFALQCFWCKKLVMVAYGEVKTMLPGVFGRVRCK